MFEVRCPKCSKLLGRSEGIGEVEIQCPNCKHLVRYPARQAEIVPRETKPTGSYHVLGDKEDRVVRPSEHK
jgi:phage FluMu protein Com